MTNFTFKEDVCALYDMELDLLKEDGKVPKQVFYKRGNFDPNFKPF